jgi:hypothetical protein
MRSPCCLCVNMFVCPPHLTFEEMANFRQQLGKHVPSAMNRHATRELLDVCFLCSPCHIMYSVCSERKMAS